MHIRSYRAVLAAAFLIFISSLIDRGASANQISGWVIGEGAVATATSVDREKLRMRAIQTAEQAALATALAANVTAEMLLVNMRFGGGMLRAIPYGKIVEKKILEEGVVTSGGNNRTRKKLYHVRIKARVMEQTGQADPSFYLDATLSNEGVFSDGDEMEIHIRPSKACHFAVFNISENDIIIPVLPTESFKKNYLAAHENFTFPGKKGTKLRIRLPEGRESITESVCIIAMLHPFAPAADDGPSETYDTASGQEALVRKLTRCVVAVPPKDRTEMLIQYVIKKKR